MTLREQIDAFRATNPRASTATIAKVLGRPRRVIKKSLGMYASSRGGSRRQPKRKPKAKRPEHVLERLAGIERILEAKRAGAYSTSRAA